MQSQLVSEIHVTLYAPLLLLHEYNFSLLLLYLVCAHAGRVLIKPLALRLLVKTIPWSGLLVKQQLGSVLGNLLMRA